MIWLWLFVFLPIAELYVLIEVGQAFGAGTTILLILLTAIIGTAVMRRQGMAALADLQDSIDQLRDPARPIAHGAMILLAGALLVVPGFLTDTMGALLLVPPLRGWLIKRFARPAAAGAEARPRAAGQRRPGQSAWPHGRVIDAEYEVVNEGSTDQRQPPGEDGTEPGPRSRSGWTRG